MNSTSSQEFESYVPVYDTVPENWEEARAFLIEHLKKVSNAINIREISWFLDEELLSGKAFIPGSNNNQQFRQILRKVIDFGSLPNNSSKSVAHGIKVDENFTLIQLFGAASNRTNPNFSYLPIPYATPTSLNDMISLSMDQTNVTIQTGNSATPRSNYTACFIVIEYIQEL